MFQRYPVYKDSGVEWIGEIPEGWGIKKLKYVVDGNLKYGANESCNQSCKQKNNTPGLKLWQRNYWEHVIRNDEFMNKLRDYIATNPKNREPDCLHIDNQSGIARKPQCNA